MKRYPFKIGEVVVIKIGRRVEGPVDETPGPYSVVVCGVFASVSIVERKKADGKEKG